MFLKLFIVIGVSLGTLEFYNISGKNHPISIFWVVFVILIQEIIAKRQEALNQVQGMTYPQVENLTDYTGVDKVK